jgi:hypothetical protein
MNENDITRLQELVRYWLLEDESYVGEQRHKIEMLVGLIDRKEEWERG